MPKPPPQPTGSTKLQRWVDLIAALLSHHGTLTFRDLQREVPAYMHGNFASLKRTFERDKDELRALGIPIETDGPNGADDAAYRLKPKNFYLPYLALVSERGRTAPSKVDKYGYHALETLTFDADELTAVAEAANRARQLGDSHLAEQITSAMRKLAFDLPIDAALASANDTTIARPRAAASQEILRALSKALVARKRVTIVYESMASGRTDPRIVEPYGLFFMSAHWYLAARDVDAGAVRNFRVSRITGATAACATSAATHYIIPPDFDLREHARSRQAWELGDRDSIIAEVEIRGQSGATTAAAALGQDVGGSPDRRSFAVRRPDVFARWCLSFAGEIVPSAPDSLVAEFERQRRETLALYER